MSDLDEAKQHAAVRSDATTWGVPILILMVLVGGVTAYTVVGLLTLWFGFEVFIGAGVFVVVAHVTGVVAGLIFEKLAGMNDE